jgi:hypothetical protein
MPNSACFLLLNVVPNNILIQRLPHAKYLGVLISLWGLVVCVTTIVHNFQQLMALRFLLGWVTKKEGGAECQLRL